jgi:hypothetical protein
VGFNLLLKSKDGSEFELNILGYEHPIKERGWFNIQIRVISPNDSWSASDPSLQVNEVRWIYKWLIKLSDGKDVEPVLDFLEPNLKFVLREKKPDIINLRIYFDLELRPTWALKNPPDMDNIYVDLVLESNDLKLAANDLYNQYNVIIGSSLKRNKLFSRFKSKK